MSLLVLPAPALGQDAGELSPSPAVNQYRESVPTAKGPKPAGREGKPAKLPSAVSERLRQQGGADADDLAAIAESPGLGAPANGRDRSSGDGGRRSRALPAPPRRGAISAAADATVDGGGMGAVVGGGLLTLAVFGGLFVLRRRSGAS